MVDSIRNSSNSPQPYPVPKKTNKDNLRENFKNLSSGLSVAQTIKEQPAVAHIVSSRPSYVGKLVDNLNDAVRSSKETLKALEDVAVAARASEKGTPLAVYAEEFDQLKSDIVDLLKTLRRRADTAYVLSENMDAADSRIEDVDAAQEKAVSMQTDITLYREQALNAHGRLSSDEVDRLLGE